MKNYNFKQNKECPFFPCHNVDDVENFNCFWCYCPLYFLKECPGNYYINDEGVKDCSECTLPHYADMTLVVGEYMEDYDWEEK